MAVQGNSDQKKTRSPTLRQKKIDSSLGAMPGKEDLVISNRFYSLDVIFEKDSQSQVSIQPLTKETEKKS
jgi:hypothetical protein